jgi:alkylation response protein AidB-like acyl-CoA dehydrogenase
MRHLCGRPTGPFRSIERACADMVVQASVAGQPVTAAVARAAEGKDASVAASMANSYAGGAAVDIAEKAMQLHGGIGYTWESGVHVYLKRAALNRRCSARPHHQRLAAVPIAATGCG